MKASLYVHIPFCTSKCGYCDFFSVPLSSVSYSDAGTLLDALISEIRLRLDEIKPETIDTIFIGGGTPSSLPDKLYSRFLCRLNSLVNDLVVKDYEFSVEANPETCSENFIDISADAGINRLSLGIQSFDQNILEKICRANWPDDVFGTAEKIRNKWARKLSLDIITGTGRRYLEDIKSAYSLSPDHISVYALTLEDGTPLAEMVEKGERKYPDQDLQADAIEDSRNMLESAGYRRYEVSNYHLEIDKDCMCKHNLNYWNMQSYIGAGPGAVTSVYSRDSAIRHTNLHDIDGYIKEFEKPKPVPALICSTENVRGFELMFEHFLMGMRLCSGPDPEVFRDRFGSKPSELIPRTLNKWTYKGLVDPKNCSLNSSGMLMLDSFLSDVWDELFSKKEKLF